MTTITVRSLLPPSSTALERAADLAAATRIEPLPAHRLWNPWTCPPQALPALAWGLSVDEWDDAWPEQVQRQVCADSLQVHARKGTVESIRRALAAAGLVNAQHGWTAHIVEGIASLRHDGTADYDGSRTYGSDYSWASWSVTLNRPVTIAQAQSARRLLEATAPARCTLAEFLFTSAAWIYDGQRTHDGSITYGAV
jgi:phage tail P2-like protein